MGSSGWANRASKMPSKKNLTSHGGIRNCFADAVDVSPEGARADAAAASALVAMPPQRVLLIVILLLSSASSSLEAEEPLRALSIGDELVGETMPLRHGRRVYRLAGLRPPAWYEVKISYPASIPSSFSIRLVSDPDAAEDQGSKNRRLLNTEKIIFQAESTKPVYVLVTVEPEGVVAKPNVKERELALFNIVCDELLLGIPRFAWWVGIAAVICLVLASLAPYFLPIHKLLNYETAKSSDADAAKLS
ncbi:uncharacterized protein [Triticum aestivum]|uniref:uncharacterized protein n=1 Tax=Triticum aestivum TaxID=4565 RepID=UPI001D0229E6|nr:uncharacterized protein LOC123115154 [Triticum aestivum]